jgi:muramidase (phage lysozyme)
VHRIPFLEKSGNVMGLLAAVSCIGLLIVYLTRLNNSPIDDPLFGYANPDLVMRDGDPHVRALMRMISASEANDRQPYSLIYGGSRASNLERHPSRCITIRNGPNRGNCSTAAGRYQMINTTWALMAKRYGASQRGWLWDQYYSFAPIEQDKVVHAWLSDPQAWGGMNIPQELRSGNLTAVRQRLSRTWTSLGYGIENNSMTSALPRIYAQVLPEELKRASQNPSP